MPIPPKTPLLALMATEASHVAELNKILTMAVNRLDTDIKALGKKGANPITLMQAKATRAALTSFMDETFDSIEALLKNGQVNAAMAASQVVSQYENQLLQLVMSADAMQNLANAEAQRAAAGINAALQRMQGSSYQPLASSVYKTQQLTLKWVDKRINQALVSGWSAQKLAGELAGMINPNVAGGVSYAAMRTARTEINNAFHASSAERYNNSPIVQEVDWHLSSSHPEGDICDSLASDSPYPKKSVPKKPHPQCYCYITPALPEPAKFLDNLFKGKYGTPPTGAKLANAVTAPAKAAGSKAAQATAQNAMHAAIKTDKKPTKETLGNQFGWEKSFSQKNIANLDAFDELVKGMDDATKAYVNNSGLATKKYAASVLPDEVEGIGAHLKNMAHPAKPDPWEEPLPDVPLKITQVFEPEDYDKLEEFLDPKMIKTLEKNNIDPHKAYGQIAQMDEDEFDWYMKIVFDAEDTGDVKWLVKVTDIDMKDNMSSGMIKAYSNKVEPGVVKTFNHIADEWGLDIKVINDLKDLQKLTPDQVEAQLVKLGKDNVAALKKMESHDQAYYIKHATMPPVEATPKPIGVGPTIKDIAAEQDIPENWLVQSGATPEQLTLFFKGDFKGGGALEDVFKLQSDNVKQNYLSTLPKSLQPEKIADYDQWAVKHGFTKAGDTPVPKTSYMQLEEEYGVPTHVWEGTGMTSDDIAAYLKVIEADEDLANLWDAAMDSFDEDDLNNVLGQAKLKLKNPPKVEPVKPPVPSVVPPPKELYESYEDVADIFIKGEWKPSLLKKTGATPQQIADYVEDMNQAQYDHFMSLKWPSQKKHFEKLATKNGIKEAEDLIDAGKVASNVPPVKPAATSDPVILGKWRGKSKPNVPQDPVKPQTPGAKAFDKWIDDAQKKFADFAKATGNLKNDLTKSNNWSYFEKVTKNNDMQALKYLQDNKYIDQKLYDDAVAAMKKSTTPDPDDARAYKAAMDKYAVERAQYEQDLVDWRAANGITSEAKGVWDDVLVHDNNNAGVKWANDNLKLATGEQRAAVKKYSGSSYHSWNSALRSNANRDTVPGSWAKDTRNADAAMAGAPEDVIVRRGTNWDEFFVGGERKRTIPPPPPNDLIGTVQVNHGYISTSVGNTAAFGGQVQMRIRIPQGHGVTWVDPYSSHKGERELLISRSSEMYIHDVYQADGQWFVDAEIIPSDQDASVWTPIKTAMSRRRR